MKWGRDTRGWSRAASNKTTLKTLGLLDVYYCKISILGPSQSTSHFPRPLLILVHIILESRVETQDGIIQRTEDCLSLQT